VLLQVFYDKLTHLGNLQLQLCYSHVDEHVLTLANRNVLRCHPPIDDHRRMMVHVQKRHLTVFLPQYEKHLVSQQHTPVPATEIIQSIMYC